MMGTIIPWQLGAIVCVAGPPILAILVLIHYGREEKRDQRQ